MIQASSHREMRRISYGIQTWRYEIAPLRRLKQGSRDADDRHCLTRRDDANIPVLHDRERIVIAGDNEIGASGMCAIEDGTVVWIWGDDLGEPSCRDEGTCPIAYATFARGSPKNAALSCV